MPVGKIEPKVTHIRREPQSFLDACDGARGITLPIATAPQPPPSRGSLLWPSRVGHREVVAQDSLGVVPPAEKDVFPPQQELIARVVRCLRDRGFQQGQIA